MTKDELKKQIVELFISVLKGLPMEVLTVERVIEVTASAAAASLADAADFARMEGEKHQRAEAVVLALQKTCERAAAALANEVARRGGGDSDVNAAMQDTGDTVARVSWHHLPGGKIAVFIDGVSRKPGAEVPRA